MKVIVAGSRYFNNKSEEIKRCVFDTLSRAPFGHATEIVSGAAAGPDTWGIDWAKHYNTPFKLYVPDWDKYGKGAGFLRNTQMAQYADALVAFWDGQSRGTKHMIDMMLYEKKPTLVVFP